MLARLSSRLVAAALGLALFASAGPPPAWAQDLGLNQCLEAAQANSAMVRQNPELSNWEREKVSAAGRRYLPRLDVDLYHQPKVDYFGRPLTEDDIYTNEVKVTQPLYASGAISTNRAKAVQGLAKAGLLASKASLESALEVIPAYYRLLTWRKVAALREALVAKAAELVEGARRGVGLGVLRQEDLLAAEARALEVSYQVAESRSQARASGFALKQLMGLEREQALELKAQRPDYYPQGNAEALVERTMTANASLRWAKAEDEYQSLGLALAQAAQGPRFNLIGRYGLEGESFPGPDKYAGVMLQCDISWGDHSAKAFYDFERQFENRTSFYFEQQDLYRKGLRLSLFDGNGSQVQEAEALFNRQKAREELREARLRMRADLLSLLEELKRQEQMRELAAKQSDLQGERLAVARAKAEAGAATPAEVLERELDLANAKARLIQSDFERDRILATICLMTGDQLKLKDAP